MKDYSRRQFLTTTAAAAGSVALLNAKEQEASLPDVLLPYLQYPGQAAMTVCLPAKGISNVAVECVGPKGKASVNAKADAFGKSPWQIWKARFEALEAGATYRYVVSYRDAQGKAATLPEKSFRALDPTAKQVRCAFVNDIHNKIPTLEAVMGQVKPEDYEFSVLNGDMENAPRSAETVLSVWNHYVRLLDGGNKPMLFVRGNHEYRGGFRDHMAALFDLPHLNLKDHPNDYRYEFDCQVGPLHLVMTDTGEDDWPNTPENNYRRPVVMRKIRERQAAWLKDLAGQKKSTPWRVFVSHIPIYNSAGWRSLPSQQLWSETLSQMGIDLAIAGHDHSWKFVAAGKEYELKREGIKETPPFPTLIGGGPALKQGTIILLEASQDRLVSRMIHSSGKELHRFKLG
ncbi:hypothetical protein Rhal01_03115 [Rubritalea halochordaticola]|uniref:Calcineurin-like phosphoesterase domain-containing protein n=1 Tax=Rubritalea halochordaticola TaxID=714537 RepID=A0ABP9V8H1_9BACT